MIFDFSKATSTFRESVEGIFLTGSKMTHDLLDGPSMPDSCLLPVAGIDLLEKLVKRLLFGY